MAADAVAHVEGGEAVEVPPADPDGRLDAALGEGCDEVGEGRESWRDGWRREKRGGDETYVYL